MKTKDMNFGMQYQRGLDVIDRTHDGKLPLLLTDDELTCLEVVLEQQKSEPVKFTFLTSIELLLETYSNPETIRNGLRVMEQLGKLDYATGFVGDKHVAPYEKQMEKVNYIPKWRR